MPKMKPGLNRHLPLLKNFTDLMNRVKANVKLPLMNRSSLMCKLLQKKYD